jgi:AraC-like DNA-binding protein
VDRDILSDLLRSVRLRGAVFFYVSYSGPWAAQALAAAQIADAVLPGCEHVMEFHMIAKGDCWAAIAGQQPLRLARGDIVMFPQGDSHVLASAPGLTPEQMDPQWVFAQRDLPKPIPISETDGITQVGMLMPVEVAETVVVCGFLGCDLRPFNPLIGTLPRMLHLPASRAGHWVAHVIEQAVAESHQRRPGGEAVLERLSEMMFVDSARRYLDGLPADATGWLAGLRDRYVGRSLALLHEQPGRDWSIEALGKEVGLSRSALHERFVQFLGQAPMQYLTNWRMQVGAGLLRASSRSVADIAGEVGYDSEAAFSRAFKRLMGMPPAVWRRNQRQPATEAPAR